MKTLKIIFVLLLICTLHTNAQKLDSLLNRLKTAKEDTNKVKLLGKIGFSYSGNKLDSAIYYFTLAKKLSDKLSYVKGILRYYSNITEVYNQLGKYDTSLILNKQSVLIAKTIGTKTQLAYTYANVGNSYENIKKNDSCAFYYLKAIAILDSINNEKDLLVMYGNLSALYANMTQYSKARDFALKSVALHKQGVGTDNDYLYITMNLSANYESLNKYDSAVYYGNETVKLCKKEKNYYMLMVGLQNLVSFKIGLHKYNELLSIVNEMEQLGKDFDTPEYHARLNYCKSIAYYYNGNAKIAEQYAFSALEISKKNKLDKVTKKIYLSLNGIEAALGNYALSDKYYSKLDSLNTSELNAEIAGNIQELEKKYETQKKENEILKLNSENTEKSNLNKILFGSTFALLALGFLGYRNFRNRQKLQQLKITELEKDKQLQSVDAMLKGQEDERNRIAKDLHDGLGGMLSGVKMSFTNMKENMVMSAENVSIFEQSILQLDSTIAELRKIAHNLMPEALVRFGLNDAIKDFCTSIQSATHINIIYENLGETRKLDNTANTYIYRIIQELINNAVKHGNPTQILVQMTTTLNKILITVEDDGKGMDANKMAISKGIGLSNIQHRVNYFKGNVDFENKTPQGTAVNIELNV